MTKHPFFAAIPLEDLYQFVHESGVGSLSRLWVHFPQLFFQELKTSLQVENLVGIREYKSK